MISPGPRPILLALALAAALPASAQTPTADQVSENLNLRFANGIVAIVEEKVITVDDLRREIIPVIPQLQRESRSEQEFNQRLAQLQDDVLQSLIDDVLIVKEFNKPKDGKEENKRQVPSSVIDNQIAEEIITNFESDRSKFLAYLRSRGLSQREYRKEVEEKIIVDYMNGQQRKSASTISPVQIETFYNENKERFYQEDQVYLRLIQISKNGDETDDALKARAADVIKQLDGGASFADVARLFSQDSRRTKGGDWGWQRKSDLRPEFSEVLFKLEKGKHTGPITMPEGIFILYVEDRKHAGTTPLNEVREQIEKMLVSNNARQARERWLERLRRNAYIKHF